MTAMAEKGHRVFFTDNSWCEVTSHPAGPGGIVVYIHGVLDCFAIDWARARVKWAVAHNNETPFVRVMRKAILGPGDSSTVEELTECGGFIHDINRARIYERNLWEAHIAEPWKVD